MKNNIKKFIKIIFEDIKKNLDCIIPASIFFSGVLIAALVSLGIIEFKAIFWYSGILLGICTVKLIWMVMGDIINYIKITWRKSKQGEFEK